MGLYKWLMKHGIGSPASVAKAMAQTYKVLKERNPSKPETEVLADLFASRMGAAQRVHVNVYGPEEVAEVGEMLRQGAGLFEVVKYVSLRENPRILFDAGAPLDAESMLDEVIQEVLTKEVPSRR